MDNQSKKFSCYNSHNSEVPTFSNKEIRLISNTNLLFTCDQKKVVPNNNVTPENIDDILK